MPHYSDWYDAIVSHWYLRDITLLQSYAAAHSVLCKSKRSLLSVCSTVWPNPNYMIGSISSECLWQIKCQFLVACHILQKYVNIWNLLCRGGRFLCPVWSVSLCGIYQCLEQHLYGGMVLMKEESHLGITVQSFQIQQAVTLCIWPVAAKMTCFCTNKASIIIRHNTDC